LDLESLPGHAALVLVEAGRNVSCPGGWLVRNSVPNGGVIICPSRSSNIIIVVVSTCLCTAAVGVLVLLLCYKLGFLDAGSLRSQQEGLPSRLLADIPTFKYGGQARKWHKGHDGNLEYSDVSMVGGEEQEACSICLAEFVEGEELRMLGCLHVFHRDCVDQWLALARECPLCKRDVVAAAAADPTVLAGAAFAARQGRSYDQPAHPREGLNLWRCRCFRGIRRLEVASNGHLSGNPDPSLQENRVEVDSGGAMLIRPTLIVRESARQPLLVLSGGDAMARGPFTADLDGDIPSSLPGWYRFDDGLPESDASPPENGIDTRNDQNHSPGPQSAGVADERPILCRPLVPATNSNSLMCSNTEGNDEFEYSAKGGSSAMAGGTGLVATVPRSHISFSSTSGAGSVGDSESTDHCEERPSDSRSGAVSGPGRPGALEVESALV
jgi:hypothetical protein